jgi:drug/metabolite transporter (DMT)-like permease
MMSNTTAGIIYGLASGALWGLIFIAPRAAEPYSEVDLAVWRYIAFGMTSLLLMAAHKRFRPHNISKHHLVTALMLGVIGYVFYYICIAFSIRLAGPALTPLIIGSLPLTLAIYGNWRDQNVAWKRLIFPLALIVVGLTCVYTATLNHSVEQRPANAVLWGCLFALAAHVSWFTYAVINSNVMLSKDAPSALGWTSLQGVGAMVGVVPLLILAPMLGWSRIADLGLWHMDGGRCRLMGWATFMDACIKPFASCIVRTTHCFRDRFWFDFWLHVVTALAKFIGVFWRSIFDHWRAWRRMGVQKIIASCCNAIRT